MRCILGRGCVVTLHVSHYGKGSNKKEFAVYFTIVYTSKIFFIFGIVNLFRQQYQIEREGQW
jgi:hypothetical protein